MAEWVDIPGATSSIFTKTSELSDSGNYRCIITNSLGTITSSVAVVTVAPPLHPDTINYIGRVEAIDGQTLEPGVVAAWDTFFYAMDDPAHPTPTADTHKIALAEGTMIPMLGARTLTGSLIPVYPDMPMPTNVGFVTSDYDRAIGLERASGTKYLDTNVLDSSLPQNDFAYGLWMVNTPPHTPSAVTYMGAGVSASGTSRMGNGGSSANNFYYRNRSSSAANTNGIIPIWLTATSRSSSSQYTAYTRNTANTDNHSSSTPTGISLMAYGTNSGSGINTPSLGIYHSVFVSRSIDLAYMDSCLTALQSSIAAALP